MRNLVQFLYKMRGAWSCQGGGSEPTRALKATTSSKKLGGSGSGTAIPSQGGGRRARIGWKRRGAGERKPKGGQEGLGASRKSTREYCICSKECMKDC
jgi:hypothetical protein